MFPMCIAKGDCVIFILLLSCFTNCQVLEVGYKNPIGLNVITLKADTKIYPMGNGLGLGLVSDVEYWQTAWKTESGLRIGVNKIYVTPYLCKDNIDYYFKCTIGYYGEGRYR